MSTTREVTVWCDAPGCNRWTNGTGSCRTAREARRAARLDGWVHRTGRDLCPYHRGWADVTWCVEAPSEG